MSRYELVYVDRALNRSSRDQWERMVEGIDGEIVEPITKKGTTRGFIIDTEATRSNV